MSTLKEVAKEAGVSTITVSRAINTPDLVSEGKREAVYAAMKKLRYLSNEAAKALVTNKVGMFMVLIPGTIELNHPFSMNFIAGISDSLSKHNYSFSLIRDLKLRHKCDGIIVLGFNEENEMATIKDFDIPFVIFGRRENDQCDWIDVDSFYGAHKMTEYLISNGHRKIGMLTINEKKAFSFDRLNGYMQALKENGIPVDSNYIKYAANLESDGYRAGMELMTASDVSAIFCSSDIQALGAVRAAKFLGKNVPHDISIAGFDGLGINLLTDPKITTIKQPVYQLGQRIAEILYRRINNRDAQQYKEMLKPELEIEQSVTKNFRNL